MRGVERLEALIDQGVIDYVERPLLSGKEADVFLVVHQGARCVAKIYKEAAHRSFKHRAVYTEGRRGRNTRRERAIQKRSRYGRAEEEAAWRSAEVDAIYRLRAAGVAVPEPLEFVDGVLVMELVADEDGNPAPRLCDLRFRPREARALFDRLLQEVVRMLCAGLIHGDLSDFNVLLGAHGPVIIDFPQAIDAAANQAARKILLRDVRNLQSFLGRWTDGLKRKRFGEELWDLYQRGDLHPDTKLTGRFQRRSAKADTLSVLEEIEAAEREARRRKGLPPAPSFASIALAHRPKERNIRAPEPEPAQKKKRRRRRKKKAAATPAAPVETAAAAPSTDPFDDLDALLSVED